MEHKKIKQIKLAIKNCDELIQSLYEEIRLRKLQQNWMINILPEKEKKLLLWMQQKT